MARRPDLQAGITLIEVLVTVVVLMVGLLGMASLQARGHQAELEAYQRSQALLLLSDMANRLSADRNNGDCYVLDAGVGTTPPPFLGTGTTWGTGVAAAGCSTLSDNQLQAWHDLLLGANETLGGESVGAMQGARGCIEKLAERRFRITVAWQGRFASAAPPTAITCGAGLYGTEAQRRVVVRTLRFADLG